MEAREERGGGDSSLRMEESGIGGEGGGGEGGGFDDVFPPLI